MTKERIAEIIREETYVATNAGGDQYIVEGYIEAAARIAAGLPTEPAQPKPPSDADIAAMQADGKPGDSRCGNDPPADTTRESAVLAGLRGQVENLQTSLNTANNRIANLQHNAVTFGSRVMELEDAVYATRKPTLRKNRPATGKAKTRGGRRK